MIHIPSQIDINNYLTFNPYIGSLPVEKQQRGERKLSKECADWLFNSTTDTPKRRSTLADNFNRML